MVQPIRLAIVGTGIFARDAYLPALTRLEDQFRIAAVSSRSADKVKALASHIPYQVDLITDYDALLARPDIDAVALVVPIGVMAEMVEAAIKAGKHVISEKPAADNVASGRKLLAMPRNSVWMVAENWRYSDALEKGRGLIDSGKIGKPIMLTWTQHLDARSGKYFSTGWRTDMSYSSGFLLDGGVHHVAAVRTLIGEVAALSAFTAQVYPDMPPAETLMSSLRFDNGAVGSYNVTYANGSPYDNAITVLGDKGSFRVRLDVLDTSGIPDMANNPAQQFKDDGVYLELADFANAIQNGKTPISTPEQAVQDVAIIEAMFRAAESGKVVAPERLV